MGGGLGLGGGVRDVDGRGIGGLVLDFGVGVCGKGEK